MALIDVTIIIANRYNKYHSTIKAKPADVKSSLYIDSSKGNNKKYHKYKICDIVIMSKHKNYFGKRYTSNYSEDVSVIKKVKNTVLWTTLLIILIKKKLLELATKKNCKKQIIKCLELEKYKKK